MSNDELQRTALPSLGFVALRKKQIGLGLAHSDEEGDEELSDTPGDFDYF